MARFIKRSDGKTIDLENEEANQADITAKAKRVIITDGTSSSIVDSIDSGLNIIKTAHQKVHDGNFYNTSKLFENVADDSSVDVLVKVGSNKKLHFTTVITVSGESFVYFYENPTISDNGTAMNIVNMNRGSSNTSDANIYYSPTVTSVGTSVTTTKKVAKKKVFP